MSVSNIFYTTTSFSPTSPALPQFIKPLQENHFGGQNTMILDSHEALTGANSLIQFLESNPHIPKGLGSREVTRTATSSCLYGLTGGIAGSFLFKNPLLLLMGLSECFTRANAQQKVGNEFQVNTYTNNSQSNPAVSSFNNSNFVVIWQSSGQDGSSNGVYGQLFNGTGTKIGNEFLINNYTTDNQKNPSVASFSNGSFVATWDSYYQDGYSWGVYGQLFDETGMKIGSEFLVNTETMSVEQGPSVSTLSNGNFVVAWDHRYSNGVNVLVQTFSGNGNKLRSVSRANQYNTDDQQRPSVTSLSNGNFFVAWDSRGQYRSGFYAVYGRLFDGTGAIRSAEQKLNSFRTDPWGPSAAGLPNGNFVVTWQTRDDGSGYGIFGQLFNENISKIGSEFQVNTYTVDDQQNPSVASLSDGNFVVTWHSFGQDGSVGGVYGQLFNGNASKIGNEFQVNTYIASGQGSPAVTSLPNGNFVVTWVSGGQDGSSSGIFGQIFTDIILTSTTSTIETSSSTTSSFSSSTIPPTCQTRTSVYSSSSSTIVPSKTKTTSPTTSSISSSTMSAIGQTRTSETPSNSRTTESSTTRPKITRRTTLSTSSDASNRFSWIWFLLGGIGAVSCLSLTSYFVFKSRVSKKGGEVGDFELGADHDYGKTPDFVTAEPDPVYSRTPDFV